VQEISKSVVTHTQFLFTTLHASGQSKVKSNLPSSPFPIVLVDEAGEATEPEVLLAISLGCEKLMLVGDPKQLPPTLLSRQAIEMGYGRSIAIHETTLCKTRSTSTHSIFSNSIQNVGGDCFFPQ
jgi:senataxin